MTNNRDILLTVKQTEHLFDCINEEVEKFDDIIIKVKSDMLKHEIKQHLSREENQYIHSLRLFRDLLKGNNNQLQFKVIKQGVLK